MARRSFSSRRMTDWNSPRTLRHNAFSLALRTHAMLGICLWEWIITLDFDLSVFSRRRNFRWPMIFYFWGRYVLMISLLTWTILLDSTTEVHCRLAFHIATSFGNTAINAASINLCIRTMAIWDHNRRIVIPLLLLALGHFALTTRSSLSVNAEWVRGQGCRMRKTDRKVWVALYGYTMVFDFIIMVLTAYKLWTWDLDNGGSKPRTKGIAKLLFKDGLVYFIVAFVANSLALIFSTMNLNPIMASMADGPAVAISSIVSGRFVRRLITYNDSFTLRLTDLLPQFSTVHEEKASANVSNERIRLSPLSGNITSRTRTTLGSELPLEPRAL